MKSNHNMSLVNNNKIIHNPFLLFLPFLLFFVILVVKAKNGPISADSYVYLQFAKNLLHGFYSPPAPDINLIEGPGLPMLLVPFVGLNLPIICITLMNAVLQYLSIVFLFKTFQQHLPYTKSLLFTLLYAFCFSSYTYMSSVITEPLFLFLISVFLYFLVRGYKTDKRKNLYLAGLILGYMALVKVIFPWVVLTLLIGLCVALIFNRKDVNYKKGLLINFIAFIVISFYMIYTYSLTSRLFYFGSAGSDSFYWMSTPFENEYGDWNNQTYNATDSKRPERNLAIALLKANHQKDFDKVSKLNTLEKDDAIMKIAMNNIINHPTKYFKNIISNVSRLLYGFPNNYTFESQLKKIWYFPIIYTLLLYSLLMTIIHWKKITFIVRFIFAFSFIYLGGSALVSAESRNFIIILPALLFWIGYIFHQSVKIQFVGSIDENEVQKSG
jgi:hypothetical protein